MPNSSIRPSRRNVARNSTFASVSGQMPPRRSSWKLSAAAASSET